MCFNGFQVKPLENRGKKMKYYYSLKELNKHTISWFPQMKTGGWQVGEDVSLFCHISYAATMTRILSRGRAQKLGHGVVVENITGREGGGVKGEKGGRKMTKSLWRWRRHTWMDRRGRTRKPPPRALQMWNKQHLVPSFQWKNPTKPNAPHKTKNPGANKNTQGTTKKWLKPPGTQR